MTATDIINTLIRMEELLRAGGHPEWKSALRQHRRTLAIHSDRALVEIVGMFGGAGSLNDIVLYQNGKLLSEENAEFDELKDRLFEPCRKAANKQRGA